VIGNWVRSVTNHNKFYSNKVVAATPQYDTFNIKKKKNKMQKYEKKQS